VGTGDNESNSVWIRVSCSFKLDEVVPEDYRLRRVAEVLDLLRVRAELALHYSPIGRPSIDPALMVRMARFHPAIGTL
jgi:hypothetical protein